LDAHREEKMTFILWIIAVCAYLIAGFLFFGSMIGAASLPQMLIACAAGIVGTVAFAALAIIQQLNAALGGEPPPPSA
jgi:hypothetical protein